MPTTMAQDAWVERVLGVTFPAGSGATKLKAAASAPLKVSPGRGAPVKGAAIWRGARDAVWAAFGGLQSKLRGAGDPNLASIADAALPELSSRLGGKLTAALTEVDSAAPDRAPAARAEALKAVDETRKMLASDRLVRLLDRNSLGVPLEIEEGLRGALDRIEGALKT